MKRMHVIGLAAVVALLVTAVGASTAFGFSEWKAAGGANPKGITIKGSGGAARFESVGKNVINCEKSESAGEFQGATEATAKVKYKGNCKISGKLSGACNEPIETKELKASPGTIAAAKSGRGLWFRPASGTVMAEPVCAGVTITVTGALVCESEPVKKLSTSGTVICKEKLKEEKTEEPGVQQFTEIEVAGTTQKGQELVANAIFTKEKDAQVTKESLTFSKEVEQT